MEWLICSSITRTVEGWTSTRFLPDFVLPSHLGLRTEEGAMTVAREILDPFGDRDLDVAAIQLVDVTHRTVEAVAQ